MKKLLSLTLAVIMILSLCACGGSGNETPSEPEAPKLELGFGKVNITPTYSVGLGGSGNDKTRRSTGLISYIYATCLAFRQNGELYLVYTIDTLSVNDELADLCRTEIIKQIPEVKPEHIYLMATHGHSCPTPYWPDENEGKYRKEFFAWMPQAAKVAIKDIAPVTDMQVAKFDLEGMSFVRHYLMNDGTYAGSNFGSTASGYKAHTYEVAKEMILVNFPREGKEPVLMVNWAAHPANAYDKAIGYNNICADHPGWCRDKLEELIGDGTKIAYFNGASGDVVPNSQIKEINHGLNAKEYGIRLAEMAYEHYDELKSVEITPIKTVNRDVQVKVEHEYEDVPGMLEACAEIRDMYMYQGRKSEADAWARQLGFSSCYVASTIYNRNKLPEFDTRELNAMSIGPVGIVTCTFEMASEHAMELKAIAPFEYVVIMSGNQRYIPREEAIDYGSYEGDTRWYVREAGDEMVQHFNNLLNEVK